MRGHTVNIFRTLFEFTVYGEATRQRARRTVAYVAWLLLLASLGAGGIMTLRARTFIHDRLLPMLDKVPTVVIRDGEAHVGVPQPWVRSLRDADTGIETALIIDTTGQITRFRDDQQGLLLMKTELVVKGTDGERAHERSVPLSRFGNVEVNARQMVEARLPKILWIGFGVLSLVLLLWFTAAKLVQALLLALVGLIANTRRSMKLRFGQLYTIALYALTPAILLDVARIALRLQIPAFLAMYALVAVTYTVAAVILTPSGEP